MPRNRNTPALFEVFGRTPTAPSHPHRVEVPPPPSPPRVHVESIAPDTAAAPAGPISPRIIRLPVGYIYVAVAVAVLLIVGSYFVGLSRGRQQGLASTQDTGGGPLIEDPTLGEGIGNPDAGANQQPQGASPSTAGQGGNAAARQPNPGPAPTGLGGRALDRDTRQAGLNYIIVERFDPAEAWAVKEFLKRNGVDALVLADNNPSLLQVVTAQGFKGWQTDSAAQALYRRIQQLGQQWKAREGGSKDFSQSFAKRHT
ncbi:MAG: hypothetical protein IT430_11830 [Phycisphaerales bacterium]|nr:hypothetical protein [Phycisphaerales bacterium]